MRRGTVTERVRKEGRRGQGFALECRNDKSRIGVGPIHPHFRNAVFFLCLKWLPSSTKADLFPLPLGGTLEQQGFWRQNQTEPEAECACFLFYMVMLLQSGSRVEKEEHFMTSTKFQQTFTRCLYRVKSRIQKEKSRSRQEGLDCSSSSAVTGSWAGHSARQSKGHFEKDKGGFEIFRTESGSGVRKFWI